MTRTDLSTHPAMRRWFVLEPSGPCIGVPQITHQELLRFFPFPPVTKFGHCIGVVWAKIVGTSGVGVIVLGNVEKEANRVMRSKGVSLDFLIINSCLGSNAHNIDNQTVTVLLGGGSNLPRQLSLCRFYYRYVGCSTLTLKHTKHIQQSDRYKESHKVRNLHLRFGLFFLVYLHDDDAFSSETEVNSAVSDVSYCIYRVVLRH
mmetsp:Transcript_31934/g.52701  ORF Transcript_31934/g.52701 Transcript_31934/m.52701 type:complete len:203 (+) Transcript_31934:745-1353(+)